MSELRLVVFDVDGTLVDSQADILRSMNVAFQSVGLPNPDRDAVLGIVGLSLDVAMARLVPDAAVELRDQMVQAYKDSYMLHREQAGTVNSSPLYPGAIDTLSQLNSDDHMILGVATGKSRRGLDKLLQGHGLEQMFVTQQVADHHPSKPHPSMLLTAMQETGASAQASAMVGDTSFDMEMARAAGMAAIGVSWGYHDRSALVAADIVIDRFEDLQAALLDVWGI
ncbi:HAD-IA family hydrolase [Shimia sp.]|uniref:HAD-IA family hydrolase n=1 Tax=Shimia sp. TaxID=1954381 RepID=UPI0032968AB7